MRSAGQMLPALCDWWQDGPQPRPVPDTGSSGWAFRSESATMASPDVDYVEVLSRLIEIDTSGADAKGCREAMAFLAPRFGAAGLEPVRVEIPSESADGREGRMALVCHRRRQGKDRLLIYTHIDVVPAEGWDAFKARRADGRVFGRGTADMKGAVAALLEALRRVRDLPLAYDLSVLVTMDEETNQSAQLEYLTSILDPGPAPHVLSMDASFGYVSIANLGLLQLDVAVHGESVHSGLAHLGRNAVEDANRLIGALLLLKERVVQRHSQLRTHPDTGLEVMEPRLNVNRVEGGLARNIVPDSCVFTVDRRLLPSEDVNEARAEMIQSLHSVPSVDWSIRREFVIPPVPPCDDPEADVLARILRDVTGSSGLYGDMISGDLPGVATRLWGGKVFGLGVIRPEAHIHGIDECVIERDMEQLVEVLVRYLTRTLKEAA